jgi:hypothetical protein
MRFRRIKFRHTLRQRMLRGLGPLMGLLALGAPLLAEPLAALGRCAPACSGSASELRLASHSSLFLRPLASLLRLAAAGSSPASRIQQHRDAVLGWDALRDTSLGGSIWMVRHGRGATASSPSMIAALRC